MCWSSRRTLLVLVSAIFSAPCSLMEARAFDLGPNGLANGVRESSIIGGAPTKPGEFDGVVALRIGLSLCSGTVVAPRLILTAAHCLGDADEEGVVVQYGETVEVGEVAAADWGRHPQFCPDCKEDIFDYGYVTLSTDFNVPDGYTLPIVDQAEWDAVMSPGSPLLLVGYGEDPGTGGAIGVKRLVSTDVRRISDVGLEFYAGAENRDTCNGDSGGPAFFRLASGELRLAGITSRGSNPCGSGGYYGAPYPALCWIRQETGVDLLGAACVNCDCLDTSPPPENDRCSVGRQRTPTAHGLWLGMLAAISAARRFRRSRAR